MSASFGNSNQQMTIWFRTEKEIPPVARTGIDRARKVLVGKRIAVVGHSSLRQLGTGFQKIQDDCGHGYPDAYKKAIELISTTKTEHIASCH